MLEAPHHSRPHLKLLSFIDAELRLVIAGIHDLDLHPEYWRHSIEEGDGPDVHMEERASAMEVMTRPIAKAAGVTYLNEGNHVCTSKSGAKFTINASPYQPEFNVWAFSYNHKEDRFNLPEHTADGVKSSLRIPLRKSIL